MFVALLLVTFLLALAVTFIVSSIFKKSISSILARIFKDEISSAWHKYVTFAIYVVGVSGGVRITELERYIIPYGKDQPQLILDTDRWVFELYRTIVSTLQSTAWLLLAFFVVALIAYGLVRLNEPKKVSEPSTIGKEEKPAG